MINIMFQKRFESTQISVSPQLKTNFERNDKEYLETYLLYTTCISKCNLSNDNIYEYVEKLYRYKQFFYFMLEVLIWPGLRPEQMYRICIIVLIIIVLFIIS